MRALVVGSSSYVAGGLINELLKTGVDVTLSNRSHPLVEGVDRPNRFIPVDFFDVSSFSEAIEGQDVIYYCAGLDRKTSSAAPDLAEYISAEVPGKIAELADASGANRFIYLSTTHVYGLSIEGESDENSPTDPVDAYAHSRVSGEKRLLESGYNQIQVSVARLGNVFGWSTNMSTSTMSLVGNDLCIQAAKTGDVIIRANPNISRNFIPLSQAARDLSRLGLSTTPNDYVYNLVWPKSLTLSEFGTRVRLQCLQTLHLDINLNFAKPAEYAPQMNYADTRIRKISSLDAESFDAEIRKLLIKYSELSE